jgi:hypothetical protein|tara:strand:- start:450 stop:569 length:120 start_codon:yes stop_codon:yes gene_type:complete
MNNITPKYAEILDEIEKEHSIDNKKGFDVNSRVLIVDGL